MRAPVVEGDRADVRVGECLPYDPCGRAADGVVATVEARFGAVEVGNHDLNRNRRRRLRPPAAIVPPASQRRRPIAYQIPKPAITSGTILRASGLRAPRSRQTAATDPRPDTRSQRAAADRRGKPGGTRSVSSTRSPDRSGRRARSRAPARSEPVCLRASQKSGSAQAQPPALVRSGARLGLGQIHQSGAKTMRIRVEVRGQPRDLSTVQVRHLEQVAVRRSTRRPEHMFPRSKRPVSNASCLRTESREPRGISGHCRPEQWAGHEQSSCGPPLVLWRA